MREILFRGKRIDNGEWVYGDLVQSPACCVVQIYEQDLCGDNFAVDPTTVGQCVSALTDKNGKKIFEGDICKITYYGGGIDKPFHIERSVIDSVLINNGCCFFEELDCPLYEIIGTIHDIEIIGNIHDNFELLEDEQ